MNLSFFPNSTIFDAYVPKNPHISIPTSTALDTVTADVALTQSPQSTTQDPSQLHISAGRQSQPSSTQLQTRRSARGHKAPSYLSNYVCSSVMTQNSGSISSPCSNTITAICCNAIATCDEKNIPLSASTLMHNLDPYSEPFSYAKATTKPK